eukprot:11867873-Karenia_brevis.AAC.1
MQWYKGVLYCRSCGGWTMTQGNPRKLVEPCKGKSPMGSRLLRAVAANKPLAFMKCQEWPQPNINPTISITLDYQTTPERDTTIADRVWNCGTVKTQ